MPNKKYLIFFIILITGFIFVYNFLSVNYVFSDNVSVSAVVPTILTCTASATSTSFGTLTTTSVSTSNPNITITMSCNNPSGCTLNVHDSGNGTNPGLYSSSVSYIIGSADSSYADTATLQAGTEGYGIQASTTANGQGGTLSLNPRFNQTGNAVGGLELTDVVVASSSQPIASREVVITHKAAISGLTKAANDYSDTLTYSCVGNS